MALHYKYLLSFSLFLTINTLASTLNVPRVLLPIFKSFPANFTLESTDTGCYKWTLSRLDIIQIIPLSWNKDLDCSSRVLLSTITKEFTKNTVIVFAEDVLTKEMLRCDVIVNVISSLSIVTKSRQLFVEESPEIFEVRAYDEQGNEFSTLEGVQFTWTISGGHHDILRKNNVLRFINFKDSLYKTPKDIQSLEVQGLKGNVILIEGIKTGTANVSVQLSDPEYRHVPPDIVQLNVIANLIIEPADVYALQGDVIYYKLRQVKNGRFIDVPLPSSQYSLIVENTSVAAQIRPWVLEAKTLGQTKLILSDVNSKMSNTDNEAYLPSVMFYVVTPAYMSLQLLPHKNWITTLYQSNAVAAQIYDSNNHKIYLGPYCAVTINIDKRFSVIETTENGSYVLGYPSETGVIHVDAEFDSVRTNENVLITFNRIVAEADILVFPELMIIPSEIAIPWHPLESSKLNYQLNVTGGDGFYQWSASDTQIVVITQGGVLKARSLGQADITAAMQKNPAIQMNAKVIVAPPSHLQILYSSVEAEIGFPIYVHIGLFYYSESASDHFRFTNCSGFPFLVDISNPDFFYNASSRSKTPSGACTTIGIVGNRSGSAVVTVSFLSDGILLKDKTTISAYEPLSILSPKSGKTVLSVGAQRYIVFTGGPSSKNGDGHIVEVDFNDSFASLEDIYDGPAENERIYLVTCRAVGSASITLKVVSHSDFEKVVQSIHEIHLICANPKSIRLYSTMLNTEVQTCRQAFKNKNPVLNCKPIMLNVIVSDEEGNIFDNATSLDVKWHLSNEDLGEIIFPGIMVLEEEDKVRYRLPLRHYQLITPLEKVGDLKVTAKISYYRKFPLTKLKIDWEEKAFKVDPELEDTITLTLVNPVHVSPESVSIFNHPKNVAKLFVTYGSGFYKFSSTAGNAAKISYSETSKSIDIEPVLPATFTLTVKDECLNSDPISVNIYLLTISKINFDVNDKIEKGKTVEAHLKLLDSEGNPMTQQNLLNLRTEMDSNILSVNCENSSAHFDDRMVCMVTGFKLGTTNLVFKAGTNNWVVRSSPIRLQVYSPLQIFPRNVTLLPGAVVQLTVKGGPQPNCQIEFLTDSDVLVVDNVGNVVGNEIGDGIVTARATGIRADGEKIEYSSDSVRVSVVYLEGIRIKTPLAKLRTDARMPIWVDTIPEQIGPLVLASVQPPLTFKWDVSSPNLAQVYNIFDEIGVKVPDSDKISMRIRALESGRVVVKVKVVAPKSIVPLGYRGVYTDSVNVEIFEDLKIENYFAQPLLLTPNIKYQLRSNKDKVARVSYKMLSCSLINDSVINVDATGLISTFGRCGKEFAQVTAVDDNDRFYHGYVDVEVSRVQYVMLNIRSDLQIDPASSVCGLPKGAKLQFSVSSHDNGGSEFTAASPVKLLTNKLDKVHISETEINENLIFDFLDNGVTVVKIYNDDSSVTPDFVKMNVVPYVQPDKAKLRVGDVICFNAPQIVNSKLSCSWNSSKENSLSINPKSGFAVAKSKQSSIVVSYLCSNNLRIVTAADVYGLQRIEIVTSSISSISNNGKRISFPLQLLNEMDDLSTREFLDSSEKDCVDEDSVFHYPYECDIKFSSGYPYDVNAIFKTYPKFDVIEGHTCVIESDVSLPMQNLLETDITLKVTWNRFQSTSLTVPFKPAINVHNKKIIITNLDPIDIIQVSGVPSVLSQVQVLPSNSKYVAVGEEVSDVKNIVKFSVYLKTAYLKESRVADQQMFVSVVSQLTGQNVTLPIHLNVNVDHYVTPYHITDKIVYYFTEYWLRVTVSFVIGLIIYLAVLKVYKARFEMSMMDNSILNLSHDRGHFSDSSMSPHHPQRKPTYNEIQMIYGRSPDRSLRSRHN